jgi:hypothetical protein
MTRNWPAFLTAWTFWLLSLSPMLKLTSKQQVMRLFINANVYQKR